MRRPGDDLVRVPGLVVLNATRGLAVWGRELVGRMSGALLAAGAPGISPGRLRYRCITATMLHLMQRRCARQEWLMCLVLAATKKTP